MDETETRRGVIGARLTSSILFLASLCAAAPSALAQDVGASGTTGAPGISFSPTSLRFVQAAQRTSRNQIVTLVNTGNTPVLLGKIAIAGPNASEFAREVSSTCVSGLTLPVGASCEMAVNFTPASVGERSAVLAVPHNAAGSPAVIALAGTATPAATQGAPAAAF